MTLPPGLVLFPEQSFPLEGTAHVNRVVWAFFVPLLVLAIVVGGIVGIGTLLLVVREATHDAFMPVWVALGLTLVAAALAVLLSATGRREPQGGRH